MPSRLANALLWAAITPADTVARVVRFVTSLPARVDEALASALGGGEGE